MQRPRKARFWHPFTSARKDRILAPEASLAARNTAPAKLIPRDCCYPPPARRSIPGKEELEKETSKITSAFAHTPTITDSTSTRSSIHTLPTELLQHIFSYLDFLALSQCRFVSRAFRACLRPSFTDLYSTFLTASLAAPSPPPLDPRLCISFDVTGTRSPLSAQGETTDTYRATYARQTQRGVDGVGVCERTLHPVLTQLGHALTLTHRADGRVQMSTTLLPMINDGAYNEEWQRMPAAEPPVSSLTVMCRFRGGYEVRKPEGQAWRWQLDGKQRGRIMRREAGGGVRVVDVVAALERSMGEVMRGTVDEFALRA